MWPSVCNKEAAPHHQDQQPYSAHSRIIADSTQVIQGEDMSSIPEVRNIAEAIAYQDGSVVSQEIVKKDTGTVTLFAFAKGQGLSEHTTPFDALVYIVDGEAEIKIDGKKYNPRAGEMIVMPANIPHALTAVKNFKMLLVMVKS